MAQQSGTSYLICANSWVKLVVLDNEQKAEDRMRELRVKYYMDNRHVYSSLEMYMDLVQWNILAVPYES